MVFMLLSCFGGVKKTGKVVGYKQGRVITKKGFYQVGELPSSWNQINLDQAMVVFRNDGLKSSISTDAFCDQAYDDSALNMLTKHLFAGLQDVKIIQEQPLMLNDRGALRTSIQATLDGLPVTVEIVVVKKNWCLFDFYLVSQPDKFEQTTKDFETFYQGFVYSGDI
jgi:hypothetical protein